MPMYYQEIDKITIYIILYNESYKTSIDITGIFKKKNGQKHPSVLKKSFWNSYIDMFLVLMMDITAV